MATDDQEVDVRLTRDPTCFMCDAEPVMYQTAECLYAPFDDRPGQPINVLVPICKRHLEAADPEAAFQLTKLPIARPD